MTKTLFAKANELVKKKKFEEALSLYLRAKKADSNMASNIEFNMRWLAKCQADDKNENGVAGLSSMASIKKLPITVLVVTWDVGHNPLGRSYMLAEVVSRVVRHCILVGFQYPRYGKDLWEPVRNSSFPVISIPGKNMPDFFGQINDLSKKIKPDLVISCKPRLPSLAWGMGLRDACGCPLVIDVDDHELSFFSNRKQIDLSELAGAELGQLEGQLEPYGETWTRLSQSLVACANGVIVSNVALQKDFGGLLLPHVRDETRFNPALYSKTEVRAKYGVSEYDKIVMFFGTPRVHKGIDVLARAVSSIDDPRYKLMIVGSSPDKSVTSRIDSLAPGRIIQLPNQSFDKIPEIIAIADVVCLPQDEAHPVSAYQLPAKAIDAVAMGVPLLVSRTEPLRQLVDDGVAEFLDSRDIAGSIKRAVEFGVEDSFEARRRRGAFLAGYSYLSGAKKMLEMIRSLLQEKKNFECGYRLNDVFDAASKSLGLNLACKRAASGVHGKGVDIVLFWKQNDTIVYGRRHDMVIKYLASRSDVGRVIVFDAPISEFDLIKKQSVCDDLVQDRKIYVETYRKLLGAYDSGKVCYNVFISSPGEYSYNQSDVSKPFVAEGFLSFVSHVLDRENVNVSEAIFWVYPKHYSAPFVIQKLKPHKVVIDVVDDHRAWPGVSQLECERLTENYRDLLGLASVSFANCQSVAESMSEFSPDIKVIPNGCDETPPRVAPVDSLVFNELKIWSGFVIGYVGNLESKIDIDLLEKVAVKFTECLVILIGSSHANPAVRRLMRFPNVRMPGVVPYEQVGAWVELFDVGMIPHLRTDLTAAMNPLKQYVYMANRVPFVATSVDNISSNNSAMIVASTHEEFIDGVSFFLERKDDLSSAFESFLLQNSWSARFDAHIDLLLAS